MNNLQTQNLVSQMISGDLSARERLIEDNTILVIKCLEEILSQAYYPFEDLLEVGSISLIQKIDKYIPELGDLQDYLLSGIKHDLNVYIKKTPVNGEETSLNLIPRNKECIEDNADLTIIKGALQLAMGECLTPREIQVLHLRYWLLYTLQEIGDELGVSKARVGQLEKQAILKLSHSSAIQNL